MDVAYRGRVVDHGIQPRRVPLLCGLFLFLALGGAGCDARPTPEDAPVLDPRVAHLRNWVPFRRGDGSLFFLDRFEMRERDVLNTRPDMPLKLTEPDLPIVGVSLVWAVDVAQDYWGRLPSLEEWRTAVEGAGYRFPWGEDDDNRLRANTIDLGLGRRTRVGTFESGRDLGRQDSCYDLFGNVAEWTLSPYAPIDWLIARETWKVGHPTLPELDAFDLAEIVDPYDTLLGAHDVLNPFAPATPFLPEISASLLLPFVPRGEAYCVVGFSFMDRLPPRHWDTHDWTRLHIEGLKATDHASDIGIRMATDPYCFLSLVEGAEGRPSPADRAELRRFLTEHPDEFRRAGQRRKRLDRDFLGLTPPGAWAEAAHTILGIR